MATDTKTKIDPDSAYASAFAVNSGDGVTITSQVNKGGKSLGSAIPTQTPVLVAATERTVGGVDFVTISR